MALLTFTQKPFVAKATGGAPASVVFDVGLYFASMTLLLKLLNIEGSSTGFKVKIETAMDADANDADWVSLGLFTTLTAVNTVDKQTFTNLLRYVRWNVDSLGGATSATFTLTGVARNP